MLAPSAPINAETKARIAIEAVRRDASLREIAAAHGVHPLQVLEWKRRLLTEAERLFEPGPTAARGEVAPPPPDALRSAASARLLGFRRPRDPSSAGASSCRPKKGRATGETPGGAALRSDGADGSPPLGTAEDPSGTEGFSAVLSSRGSGDA